MRLKFRKQASKIKQKLTDSRIDVWQRLTKIAPLTSILLLLIGSWATTGIAQAETARIDNITIERQPDENYESLIGRAEAAARTAVQQGFDQGSQVTNVSVVVLGQNQGIIAPVLVVELSRPEWNSRQTQNGITYFSSARSLLRLDEQQLANTNPNQSPEQATPSTPPGGQQNNSSFPGSSREVINSTPAQQSPTTLPGATPLPGGPALTPNPQEPVTTPTTSPGDTSTPPSDTSNPNNNPGTTNSTPVNNSTETTNPTPVNNDTPQITGPTPVNEPSSSNSPQGTPSNNTNPNTAPTQF